MKRIRNTIIPFTLMILVAAGPEITVARENPAIAEIMDLNPNTNKGLRELRENVKKSLHVIKGLRPAAELPNLRFYRYRLKKDENFWTVLARSSLDIDTLMTVNDISSPGMVKPGTTIYLTNMRGIIMRKKSPEELQFILRRNRINAEYVRKTNAGKEKVFLFIPCGEVGRLERSLFLGTGFTFPLHNGRRTSGFGTRKNPFDSRRSEFHSGIDLACPSGSPVMASRDGTVVFSGYREGYGNLVVISHEHGYNSLYGHLSKALVTPGQKVKRGDRIALSGNTGRSTGPHLHFEVRKDKRAINPGNLIRG
jgi:murein DD-endopeptidase MepM/ murein hydrolase activator NlpD